MSASYTAKEGGYAYLYVSNEHPTQVDVYFDDIYMNYTPSRIIQGNEYYPFGAQTARSWTRESAAPNNFLGNGGTEYNATSSQYDLDFRNYDPILGRLTQVDPMSNKYGGLSPYHFSFNNPVTWNDPTGADSDGGGFNIPNGPYQAGTPFSFNFVTGRPANQESPGQVATRQFWNEVAALREAKYGGGSAEEFVLKYGATYEFWMRGKDYTNKEDGSEVFNLQGYFLKPVFKATIANEATGDPGRLFSNEGAAYRFMWNNSFGPDGRVRQEVVGFLTPKGVLVLPTEGTRINGEYGKNSERKSYSDFLPLSRKDGNLYVTFNDELYQVLGQVHTHPNTQPFGPWEVGPDIRAQKNLGVSVYMIRTNGFYDVNGIVYGTREQFFNGSESLLKK